MFAPANSGPTVFGLDFSLAMIAPVSAPGPFGPLILTPGVELDGYPRAQTGVGVVLSAPSGGEAAVVSVVRLEEGGVVGPPGTIQTGERRHGRVTRPAPRGTRR